MANQKTKKYISDAVFSGFSGINVPISHSGKVSTEDITNWRIRSDGALEKRCGFRFVHNFGSIIDAFWSGVIHGKFYFYVFSRGKIMYYDFSTQQQITLDYPAISDRSNPRFFYYRGRLHLAVSGGIFEIDETSVTPTIGYVPLMGKDWRNDFIGEIYQPLNVLNRKARFTYTVAEESSIFFRVVYPVASIDSVKINGEEIRPSRYYFDKLFNSVDISEVAAKDRVEIAVTFDLENSESLTPLLSSSSSAVFGGINNSRVFMWNKSGKPQVFATAFVSHTDENGSEAEYPGSGCLYFPEGYDFTVGDGKNTITSAIRHYDRLLFFTDGDVWMADSSACGYEDFPVMNINSSLGCPSEGAVGMAGNDPISVGNKKIYRWTSDTDELNECNAYCISEPLGDLLGEDFFKNAKVFTNRADDEVWFYDPNEGDTVWIFGATSKHWYKYTGISADGFFDANGSPGFFKNGSIYIFDRDCYTDVDINEEREISAEFVGGYMTFGTDKTKKLSSISYSGDNCRGLTATISPTGLKRATYDISSSSNRHAFHKKRICSGRFKDAKLTLQASGSSRPIIHSFTVSVK